MEFANQIGVYLLTQAHFRIVISAEILGAHSFNVATGWDLCVNRPNNEDLAVVREYSNEGIKLFQDPEAHFDIDLSEFEYHPQDFSSRTEKSSFHPSRLGESCSMCLRCEQECPVQAMDATTGEVDVTKCMKCMHCVKICPDDALKIADASEIFPNFMIYNKLTLDIVKKKKSKFYSSYSSN